MCRERQIYAQSAKEPSAFEVFLIVVRLGDQNKFYFDPPVQPP
ncbi:predicted protein [Botrytis cinerea T4]|uniref:Uncharacterized protein n=1 Tax=Botryotinia fuckeliana (strain T4) TaxID=999810 RepID=G2YF15_BOTF4|nr:predicted protein [Botrytis cinerea T4]